MKGKIQVIKNFSLAVVVFCLCGIISCSREAPEKEFSSPVVSNYSSVETEILSLVNTHRKDLGLNELHILPEISEQADFHCQHMAKLNELCHHNFGSRFNFLKVDIEAKAMGENVGAGYQGGSALFDAWLRSKDHRKITEGNYTHFGIATAKADGENYVTLIFIRK